MSDLMTKKCDKCGKIKQPGENAWWVLVRPMGEAKVEYEVMEAKEYYAQFQPLVNELGRQDLCSEGCLQKAELEVRMKEKKEENENEKSS